MGQAIELARHALGTTAPNPAVGALLVRDGQVLGRGFTRPAGQDHAEVVAIDDARQNGHDLAGSTMFVTLEPCCHWGRTPPCTDAILKAGIRRVVVGVQDEYPPMRGNGLRQLRDAGVEVELGVASAECGRLVRGFQRVVCLNGLPEVTAKVAISLDGNLATASGESQWITGPEARAAGHRLRAGHDAILVGIGTALLDDPRLTCREPDGTDPTPVVLDSQLRLPANAKLFESSRRPVVLCAHDAPERDLQADIVRVDRGPEGLNLSQVLAELGRRGLHRVLIEGGGLVHRSFLDAKLVDSLYVFVAGTVLAGGRSWLAGSPLEALADAPRFGAPVVSSLGSDVLLRYELTSMVTESDTAPTPQPDALESR
jgi:diaminohydroxyphosphoribosylaminopyrimidine deaminase/5-amino-6-(5-phosphoribosylamino)uracil reductase